MTEVRTDGSVPAEKHNRETGPSNAGSDPQLPENTSSDPTILPPPSEPHLITQYELNDLTKVAPSGNGSLQQASNGGYPRPSLTRIDSRSGIPPRLGYPNPQGAQFRPPQPRPPFSGTPQFGPRPPLQRNPSSGQFNLAQVQQPRQNSPAPTTGLRPTSPFPRAQTPPSPRAPAVYQQRLFPTPAPIKSPISEQVLRSQTLDNPDGNSTKNVDYSTVPAAGGNEEEISEAPTVVKTGPQINLAEMLNSEYKYVPPTATVEETRSNAVDNKTVEEVYARPESRAHRIIDEDISDRKQYKPIAQPKENVVDEYKVEPKSPRDVDKNKAGFFKPEETPRMVPSDKSRIETSAYGERITNSAHSERISNSGQGERVSRSPTYEPKLNLKLDENRPVSPRISKAGEVPKSPSPVQRKIEKPSTLRPDRNVDYKNGLLKSPTKSEGDNDSGVDESTQGNDQSSNGDHSSPRKPSGKIPSRSAVSPTKSRSISRGSKSPNPRTPDSPTPSTPGATDKKKLPMNKVQVGSAPSPNLKVVKSKIGSLQNTSYKPGGGNVKIENKKINLSNAQPKITAKNQTYVPGGGEKKIEQRKLQWNASSKIGSLDNAHHKPKGGDKKIETIKLDFKDKAKPKVGSKDNMKHTPGGGDIKIETKKLDLKAKSKVGSLDNVKYKPGGGDKKIFDDKDYLRQKSGLSGENNSLNGSQNSLPSQEVGEPVSDENLNRE